MRLVYIQTHSDGRFLNTNVFVAFEGFRALGYEIKTFVLDDLATLPLSPNAIVVGNIGTVWRALEKLGVPQPPYLLTPECLKPFLGRDEWMSTLGGVRSLAQVPIFIKPLERDKTFTGHVVKVFRDLIETAPFPDDLPVLAQTPVEFSSEWRVFMLKGEVLGVGHYHGDPLLFPDSSVIKTMLSTYTTTTSPAAYVLDVGITREGQTLLVELNDGYALGAYGLPAHHYARLLEARWDELCAAATV